MFTGMTVLLGLMCFAWTGVHTKAGMYVFSVFFGLANGAAQGVFVGSLASLTADPRRMGTRFGMVCSVAGLATLVGPPMAGAIVDGSGGGYTGMFLCSCLEGLWLGGELVGKGADADCVNRGAMLGWGGDLCGRGVVWGGEGEEGGMGAGEDIEGEMVDLHGGKKNRSASVGKDVFVGHTMLTMLVPESPVLSSIRALQTEVGSAIRPPH